MKDLGSERYVSITSFRQDGTAVVTPVWVVYLTDAWLAGQLGDRDELACRGDAYESVEDLVVAEH